MGSLKAETIGRTTGPTVVLGGNPQADPGPRLIDSMLRITEEGMKSPEEAKEVEGAEEVLKVETTLKTETIPRVETTLR